jgi:arsenite-transporting ATPase
MLFRWRRGVCALVVSTDPAHSLADAFDKPIGFQTAPLCPNLWGLEIDAEVEAKKYMKSIQDKMLDLVSAAIVDEIKRQIEIAYMSPGAEEAAIFDKFIELMEAVGRDYDAIVFDTAPTGHTLRLLTLPEILGAWIEHLGILFRAEPGEAPHPGNGPGRGAAFKARHRRGGRGGEQGYSS